jgi:hypothetical protein
VRGKELTCARRRYSSEGALEDDLSPCDAAGAQRVEIAADSAIAERGMKTVKLVQPLDA